MEQGSDGDGLSRRDLVKRGAAGAATAAAGAALPASATAARGPRRQRAKKVRLSEAETSRAYLMGFASLTEEVSIDRLPVEGVIPKWLTGTLVRNGPAKWEVSTRSFNHWVDGMAMLHGFSFHRGRVSYANRFLRTSQYEAVRKTGKITYKEFGTDPCRGIFNSVAATAVLGPVPNALVTVKQVGDRFVANTETTIPVVFDPKTLETLGVDDRSQSEGRIGTAHLHRDPRTGEMFDYHIRLGSDSAYIVRVFRNGRWHKVGEIAAGRKVSYIHSFALTERYVVLGVGPLVVNPLDLAVVGRPFIENYAWEPERGMRFLVMDRRNGQHVATLDHEAFFCFHQVNAWDEGSRIVLDLIAHDDHSIIDDLYLARCRGDVDRSHSATFHFRRYLLDPQAKAIKLEKRDTGIELPVIDYERHNTRPYRYAWGVGLRDARKSGFVDEIRKLDTATGAVKTWWERGAYPGEPIFAWAPRAHREDSGVLLSVVLDGLSHTSYLLVLDARTLKEIGRARVPHHIPFGTHGELFNV